MGATWVANYSKERHKYLEGGSTNRCAHSSAVSPDKGEHYLCCSVEHVSELSQAFTVATAG